MSKRSSGMPKSMEGKVCAAISKYAMIEDGDRIAIGVSGGKDSVYLLYMLSKIRKYYRKKFDIHAITLDPVFNNESMDLTDIEAMCRELKVDYTVQRFDLAKLIFEQRKEKNPCSLCSKMRRGILNNESKSIGCNKIALGHNYDDVIQTFFMNLFSCGNIGCFSPKSYLSRKDIYMIRPLIFCKDEEIKRAVKKNGLPISKSKCPIDNSTNRAKTEEVIKNLERLYPDLRAKVMGALQRGHIDGWEIKNQGA